MELRSKIIAWIVGSLAAATIATVLVVWELISGLRAAAM